MSSLGLSCRAEKRHSHCRQVILYGCHIAPNVTLQGNDLHPQIVDTILKRDSHIFISSSPTSVSSSPCFSGDTSHLPDFIHVAQDFGDGVDAVSDW